MKFRELKKHDFVMEDIRIFDVFAGIGSLHQAHKKLGVPIKIIALSEIDVDAIISYAGIHVENFIDSDFEYPSESEMKNWLMERNIGYSYEKDKSFIPRLKKDKLYKVYKASVLLNNLGDISKIDYDKIKDFDLMNFSFSCTDISNAGKQKGMRNEDGTPTRSGLYVYGIKAIRSKKPKYVMIENVKGLIQKKFIDDFNSIINELEEIGYNCYYPTKEDKKGNKVPTCLNTKNFGIPQNRERIFVFAIRKDLDDKTFEFNYGFESDIRLKDILEDAIDDKYYLPDKMQNRFTPPPKDKMNNDDLDIEKLKGVLRDYKKNSKLSNKEISMLLNKPLTLVEHWFRTDECFSVPDESIWLELKNVLNIDTDEFDDAIMTFDEKEGVYKKGNRCYYPEGISPTITCASGDEKILVQSEINQNGEKNIEKDIKIIDDKYYIDKQKDFFIRNSFDMEAKGNGFRFEPHLNRGANIAKCITTRAGARMDDNFIMYSDNVEGEKFKFDRKNEQIDKLGTDFRIRKLTTLECWRLQGFDDDCFERAKNLGLSDSSLYKQAGNSITVDVLYWNFLNLYKQYLL